jgi:isoquinoline 1-oxidoreductase beta subunit
MRATVDEKGMPTAWLQRDAFPTIMSNWDPSARHGAEFELSQGFTDLPYMVPNLQIENGEAEAYVRIGWMRSVSHVFQAMAVCSFPDELAHRAGRDPYDYLLELLGPDRHISLEGVDYENRGQSMDRFPIDVGRLRHVTERVAALADWGKELPRGSAQGIACHRSFLSYCAHVVEVEVTKSGELKIPRVCVVIDPGTVIHPDRVRAQLEGAAVFATGLARYGEITAKKGRIQQSNFDDFEMARIDDSPQKNEMEIVSSDKPPAGVGEVGVPTFAPALCNAIFAATGKRIRRLPLSRHDLSWS